MASPRLTSTTHFRGLADPEDLEAECVRRDWYFELPDAREALWVAARAGR